MHAIYFYVQTHSQHTTLTSSKLKNIGYVPLIFCHLRLHLSQRGVSDTRHRKLSHPFSQLASSKMTERNGSPAICLSDPNMTMIISPRCNPILWHGTGKYVTYFFWFVLFCFNPPSYRSTLPSLSPSLFFSLIFRSQGDVFQAGAESLLSTCSPAPDI